MRAMTPRRLIETVDLKPASAEVRRLVNKWAATGLLEGLRGRMRENMARLLENQAAQLLRESATTISTGGASLTSSGLLSGFTNVAFPIVRRVFANLIANELVSVQPMSLPHGLISYLDFTYGSNVGGDAGLGLSDSSTANTYTRGQSIYGNPSGSDVRTGALATGGQYHLAGTGFSRVHKNATNVGGVTNNDIGYWSGGTTWTHGINATVKSLSDLVGLNARFSDYDSAVENAVANNTLDFCFMFVPVSNLTSAITNIDLTAIDQISIYAFNGSATAGGVTQWGQAFQGGTGVFNLRRLNERGNWNSLTGTFTPDALNGTHIKFVLAISNTGNAPQINGGTISVSAPIADRVQAGSDGSTVTIPSFESDFGTPPSPAIPELNLKIQTVGVTATTRKLRARWSPENAQDLAAYYNIDVEVELTNLLSEAITLDIDREILHDLLVEAQAARLFWSRAPGKIVEKTTGREVLHSSTLAPGPQFFGNVREWYETLLETITDAANTIYKKTLRGTGNFIVTSPDVCTILEHLTAYKAVYKLDSDGQMKETMTVGPEAVGTINNRYVVYKDPYFPPNKILVGYRGSHFLETGYVYAPYVPLILTPVIYGTEDFTPRKGIMTRYGKKMVRADFYAVITVLDMGII